MSPAELLARAQAVGVEVLVGSDGQLRARRPGGVPRAIAQELRAHRDELRELLGGDGHQAVSTDQRASLAPAIRDDCWPYRVSWGRERGVLVVQDPVSGEDFEVLASDVGALGWPRLATLAAGRIPSGRPTFDIRRHAPLPKGAAYRTDRCDVHHRYLSFEEHQDDLLPAGTCYWCHPDLAPPDLEQQLAIKRKRRKREVR